MPAQSFRNGASVLVVNDDRAVGRLIRHNLEDKYTHVIESDSDNVTVLNEQVDLIVLDIGLADSKSWATVDRLRSAEGLRNTPLILISAEPPRTSLTRQFKPNDCIQKPFDVRDFLIRVRRAMSQQVVQPS